MDKGLTNRETEVWALLAQGKTNADIATTLGITQKTVKAYCTAIFKSLQVSTRTQAALKFVDQKVSASDDWETLRELIAEYWETLRELIAEYAEAYYQDGVKGGCGDPEGYIAIEAALAEQSEKLNSHIAKMARDYCNESTKV